MSKRSKKWASLHTGLCFWVHSDANNMGDIGSPFSMFLASRSLNSFVHGSKWAPRISSMVRSDLILFRKTSLLIRSSLWICFFFEACKRLWSSFFFLRCCRILERFLASNCASLCSMLLHLASSCLKTSKSSVRRCSLLHSFFPLLSRKYFGRCLFLSCMAICCLSHSRRCLLRRSVLASWQTRNFCRACVPSELASSHALEMAVWNPSQANDLNKNTKQVTFSQNIWWEHVGFQNIVSCTDWQNRGQKGKANQSAVSAAMNSLNARIHYVAAAPPTFAPTIPRLPGLDALCRGVVMVWLVWFRPLG